MLRKYVDPNKVSKISTQNTMQRLRKCLEQKSERVALTYKIKYMYSFPDGLDTTYCIYCKRVVLTLIIQCAC